MIYLLLMIELYYLIYLCYLLTLIQCIKKRFFEYIKHIARNISCKVYPKHKCSKSISFSIYDLLIMLILLRLNLSGNLNTIVLYPLFWQTPQRLQPSKQPGVNLPVWEFSLSFNRYSLVTPMSKWSQGKTVSFLIFLQAISSGAT